ncbi:MAG: hypothetical protein PHE24_06840 [Patescibacteria group bacterium]|nr:hypothetical protein [Patescibacteria group bacterium]
MRQDMFAGILGPGIEFLAFIFLIIIILILAAIAEAVNFIIYYFKRTKDTKFNYLSNEFGYTAFILAALTICGILFFGEVTWTILMVLIRIIIYPFQLFALLYKNITSPY